MKNRKVYLAGYSQTGPELGHVTMPIYEKPIDANPPQFITTFYSTKVIEEWSSWDDEILTLRAQFWHPGSLRYSIIGKTPFQIGSENGKILLVEPIDREIASKVTIQIEARTEFS